MEHHKQQREKEARRHRTSSTRLICAGIQTDGRSSSPVAAAQSISEDIC